MKKLKIFGGAQPPSKEIFLQFSQQILNELLFLFPMMYNFKVFGIGNWEIYKLVESKIRQKRQKSKIDPPRPPFQPDQKFFFEIELSRRAKQNAPFKFSLNRQMKKLQIFGGGQNPPWGGNFFEFLEFSGNVLGFLFPTIYKSSIPDDGKLKIFLISQSVSPSFMI